MDIKKNKENIFGVKIGDIFCFECELAVFFQVVDLRGKTQVVVREIESKVIEEINITDRRIMPIKNKFTERSIILKKGDSRDESNEGDIKTVSLNYNNIPQLTGLYSSNAFCTLWDGKSKIDSNWSALLR